MSSSESHPNRETAVTSPLLRRINAGTVLNALRERGPATASELMSATGLTRPTIHTVCGELIELGWVTELEKVRPANGSRTGRRARRYEFNARAAYVLGLDVGAHTMLAAVADLRGNSVAEGSRSFAEDATADERYRNTHAAAHFALERAGIDARRVLQAVVGVPAPIGADGRAVGIPGDRPRTTQVELTSLLLAGLPWPVVAENDANLAILAERWRGAAAGVDNAVAVLTGERLGAGVYLGGRLIRGVNGSAGEMAFLDLVEGVGSAEGIGLVTRRLGAEAVARSPADAVPDRGSLRARANGDPDRVSAEMVFDAVRSGDQTAIEILDRVTTRFARALAALATLLNPELIVIGGAPAQAADVLLEPLEQRTQDLTPTPVRLDASTLGSHAVVTGAIRLALEHIETRMFPEPTAIEPRPAGPR